MVLISAERLKFKLLMALPPKKREDFLRTSNEEECWKIFL